ncbi:unnamed protein product [Rotaria sp. Silwood2]|nr:unnamed protein product [Rotaria sp. Silwood2]CAF4325748.1 unnamed protein product [Rotaria sp. Silwood2]
MFQAINIFSTDDTSRSPSLPRRKQIFIHSLLQLGTIICSIIAFTAIYLRKEQGNRPHFTSWHGFIGLIAFVWSLLQALCGLFLTIFQRYIRSIGLTYAQLRMYHATSGVVLFTVSCFVLVLGLASNWFKNKMPNNTIIYSIIFYLLTSSMLFLAHKCVEQIFEMNSTQLFFHIRRLSVIMTKYHVDWNSSQQYCLLHTSLPLMNMKKLIDNKDSIKSDGYDELPHMRIKANASTDEKGMHRKEQL